MSLNFIFRMGTKIIFRKNAIRELGVEVDTLGGKRVMIVTDKTLVEKTDIVEKAKKSLGSRLCVIFDEVIPDSSCEIVNKGYSVAKDNSIDCIVSIGGGSSIDTAKAILILMNKGGKIEEHSGAFILSSPTLPHIAVPTTAGTGSEVSHVSVIKDLSKKRKLLFVDWYIMPSSAILDPLLTVNMPPSITAYTGVDALAHCIEAIHSLQNNPISDAFAIHGIRLIKDNLPKVLEKPDDVISRGNMLIAASMGGAAFTNAQVGVVHAVAHSIGARYGIPHGLANSLILPHGMRFNLDSCPRYSLVANAFGVSDENPEKGIEAVENFIKKLGIPTSLKEVGIPESDFEKIAEDSIQDGSIISNPKFAADVSLLKEILKNAYIGI